MWKFQQGFPVSFNDFLGSWIPGSLLKSHPVSTTKQLLHLLSSAGIIFTSSSHNHPRHTKDRVNPAYHKMFAQFCQS